MVVKDVIQLIGLGNVNQHVCIIRPITSKILTKYFHLTLISGYGQILIEICQTGANREGLNFQQIKVDDYKKLYHQKSQKN